MAQRVGVAGDPLVERLGDSLPVIRLVQQGFIISASTLGIEAPISTTNCGKPSRELLRGRSVGGDYHGVVALRHLHDRDFGHFLH